MIRDEIEEKTFKKNAIKIMRTKLHTKNKQIRHLYILTMRREREKMKEKKKFQQSPTITPLYTHTTTSKRSGHFHAAMKRQCLKMGRYINMPRSKGTHQPFFIFK